MSTSNGGPAFPCQEKAWMVDQSGMEPPALIPTQCSGMSLRDYFAAKAITGLVCEPQWSGSQSFTQLITDDVASADPAVKLAFAAYRLADAMLNVRNETTP